VTYREIQLLLNLATLVIVVVIGIHVGAL